MTAEVIAHPRLTYTARAVAADGTCRKGWTRGTMADARDRADHLSGCPQPCECGRWQERLDG